MNIKSSFKKVGNTLVSKIPGLSIDLGAGGLTDSTTLSPIAIGDALNVDFDTTNQTILGAVNEIHSQLNILEGIGAFTTYIDPALNAILTSDIDDYIGVVITTTGASNSQTLPSPTVSSRYHNFTVINSDVSTNSIDIIGTVTTTLLVGEKVELTWDGSAWISSTTNILWVDMTTYIEPSNNTRDISTQGNFGQAITTPEYGIDITDSGRIAGAIITPTIQLHTTGATVEINNLNRGLYVNPAALLAALTITLPSTPINGQEILISFGGTITTGVVVTTLSIIGNAGHTILAGDTIVTAFAGDGYILKFESSTNLWRIF